MEEKIKVGQFTVKNKEKKEIAVIDLFIGENTIGRISGEEDMNLSALLDDNFLSRKHFIVDIEKDQYERIRFFLKDNKSSNGTWIKNNKTGTVKKLQEKDRLELSDSDTILGGETYFILEIMTSSPVSGLNTKIVR